MAERAAEGLHGFGVYPSETVARLAGGIKERLRLAAIAKESPLESMPQPKYRRFDAWEHQLRAYHFALHLPATMLNMAMGTGKTKVSIDLVMNRNRKRVLVICPHSAIEDVWLAQTLDHWSPDLPAPVVLPLNNGSVAQKVEAAKRTLAVSEATGRTALVAINYESAWRDPWASWSLEAGWDMLILDESHKVKNPRAKTTQYAIDLAEVVPHVLLLSGTPLTHSPMDAWSQFRMLDPGVFGDNFFRFQMRYGIKGGFQGKQIVGYRNLPELSEKIYQIAFRAEKDVLDLPPVQDDRRSFDLEPEARQIYDQLEDEFYAAVGRGEITVNNALTQLLRLQQITGGWAKLDEEETPTRVSTAKQALLGEIIEEIEATEPVVVFCRFQADLDAVHEEAAKHGQQSYELSGRARELQQWKAAIADHQDEAERLEREHALPAGAPVLAVQIQAGGAGIDLSMASYGIYYSVGFSLGDYEQSRARLDRPGQKQSVRYYRLVARDTVDVRVYGALRKRKRVIDSVIARED